MRSPTVGFGLVPNLAPSFWLLAAGLYWGWIGCVDFGLPVLAAGGLEFCIFAATRAGTTGFRLLGTGFGSLLGDDFCKSAATGTAATGFSLLAAGLEALGGEICNFAATELGVSTMPFGLPLRGGCSTQARAPVPHVFVVSNVGRCLVQIGSRSSR